MENDIARTCSFFRLNREIRVLGNYVFSGIFNDTNVAIDQILNLQKQQHVNGIYISLNETDLPPNNKIVISSETVFPKAENFIKRSKLMIDLDPKIDDLNHIINLASKVEMHLGSYGFSQPLIACSGRGIHIIYDVDAPNNTVYNVIFKKVLKYISLQFNDEVVDIDKNVYTAGRHAKLYGTITRKNGQERLSYIIQEPSGITSNDSIIKVSSNIKDSIIISDSSQIPSNLSQKTKQFIETGCTEGKRNLELFRSACDFAAKNHTMDSAIGALSAPAMSSGLEQTEIINTIKSAYAKPRIAQIIKSNYKLEWKGFPYSNHPYAMEFDIRRITSNTPPWNSFFGETVIKANPGWITESGVSINDGQILGIKYLYLDESIQAQSVTEWLEKIKNGEPCYFLYNS